MYLLAILFLFSANTTDLPDEPIANLEEIGEDEMLDDLALSDLILEDEEASLEE